MSITKDLVKPLTTSLTKRITGIYPFIFSVKTDNAGTSGTNQFTIPTISGGNYDFYVDKGDGSAIERRTSYTDNTLTFASTGTYTVKIWGTFQGWSFALTGDCEKMTNVSQWGIFRPGNDGRVFDGCLNMDITATDTLNLSGVSQFNAAFRDCIMSTIPNITSWNWTSVTNINSLFAGCVNLNQDLSGVVWGDAHVPSSFRFVFNGCTSFNSLGFPTPQGVDDYTRHFNNCTSLDQDISYLDWSNINNAALFLGNVTLSTANYNKLLATINNNPHLNNVTLDGGNSQYDSSTGGFDGTTSRAGLVSDGWTITDGGPA